MRKRVADASGTGCGVTVEADGAGGAVRERGTEALYVTEVGLILSARI